MILKAFNGFEDVIIFGGIIPFARSSSIIRLNPKSFILRNSRELPGLDHALSSACLRFEPIGVAWNLSFLRKRLWGRD